jgi:hypothetical protein
MSEERRKAGRAFFTGEKINDLSMGSSSSATCAASGNFNDSELTGNNREYQGIFAKELSRPQQYQCVGFQSTLGAGNNREFDGGLSLDAKRNAPATIAGAHEQSCYFPTPTLAHTMSRVGTLLCRHCGSD